MEKNKVRISTVLKVILFALFATTASISSLAQTNAKKITTRPIAWYSYINTLQLSGKWMLTSQVSERNFLDNGHQAQFLMWSKVNYTLGSNWDVGAGFAYFRTRVFDPASASTLAVPELRPFQEFNNKQKIKKITLSHRYRLEERYLRKTFNDQLIDGYNFNFRIRYQFTFDYSLYASKDNTRSLNIKAGDEIMLNAGKHIVHNMFDQNRVFVSLNYKPVNNLSFEAGYMNAFQERSSGTEYNKANIYRFSIFHTLKLYK